MIFNIKEAAIMKVSHILYKVSDLNKSVKQWEDKGFVIEYGKAKNPYNALIYFSDGPYLELFQNSGMPKFVKLLLRLFGKGAMVNRMNTWEQSDEGLIGVCIENYKDNLDEELAILENHDQKYFKTTSKRLDTKQRLLHFTVAFPDEMKIPFLMTYFNVDPKPKNFVHPNGIVGIESISFGTKKDLMDLIYTLCDDPILKLYEGDGIKDIKYLKK
jgi:hypothetical protein